MSDERKAFIATIVQVMWDLESIPKSFMGSAQLGRFLNEANVRVIRVLYSESSKELKALFVEEEPQMEISKQIFITNKNNNTTSKLFNCSYMDKYYKYECWKTYRTSRI